MEGDWCAGQRWLRGPAGWRHQPADAGRELVASFDRAREREQPGAKIPPEPHGRSAAPASGASRRAGESKAKVLVHQQHPMSWVSSVDRGLDATRSTIFGFGQNGSSALMSATNKPKNKIDDVTGQAKEKFGEATK